MKTMKHFHKHEMHLVCIFILDLYLKSPLATYLQYIVQKYEMADAFYGFNNATWHIMLVKGTYIHIN